MNYKKIYRDLVAKAKRQVLPEGTYIETHHILMKSLGGSNDKNNLVDFTARQHYIAHLLLYRAAKELMQKPGSDKTVYYKTLYALAAMIQMPASLDENGKAKRAFRFGSKTYEQWKHELAIVSSERMRDWHRKNGYRVGEKNSQFGMIAIYNETTFERAMQPNDQPVPAGWSKGRFYNATPEELQKRKAVVDQILRIRPESKANIRMKLPQLEKILNAMTGKAVLTADEKESAELRRISKERALAEKKKALREMYLFYDKHGFAAMVKKFGYPYSSANFVQQCARHVPEYVPQNGKKRGVWRCQITRVPEGVIISDVKEIITCRDTRKPDRPSKTSRRRSLKLARKLHLM